jgi:hypothetical protein
MDAEKWDNSGSYKPDVKFDNGKRVIIRCRDSGVLIGEVIDRDGQNATIRNPSVLWGWEGANTLMEIANSGVNREKSKISQPHFGDVTVTDLIMMIPFRKEVDLSPVWNS